jgi:hypothetical protein
LIGKNWLLTQHSLDAEDAFFFKGPTASLIASSILSVKAVLTWAKDTSSNLLAASIEPLSHSISGENSLISS